MTNWNYWKGKTEAIAIGALVIALFVVGVAGFGIILFGAQDPEIDCQKLFEEAGWEKVCVERENITRECNNPLIIVCNGACDDFEPLPEKATCTYQ